MRGVWTDSCGEAVSRIIIHLVLTCEMRVFGPFFSLFAWRSEKGGGHVVALYVEGVYNPPCYLQQGRFYEY